MKPPTLFLLFFLLLISIQNPVFSQELNSRIDKVENGLTLQKTLAPGESNTTANLVEQMKNYKIQGASVAVVSEGRIDWSKTYGVSNSKESEPITKETLFQCASIGKVITALTVLSLVEEGALSLDEDVSLKLQRWKVRENELTRDEKVTLRYLLSHSAGFTDEYGFKGYDPEDKIPSIVQILNGEAPSNARKTIEVETIPGQKERYSGAGYLVIQVLLEDVTGQNFEEVVQKRVLDPFQMTHTTYSDRPDKTPGVSVAAGHQGNGKPLKNKKYNIYPEKSAAGPWTTAEDLAKLVLGIQALSSDDSEFIKNMMTPQINNKGLGVNLKGLEKPEAFWHAGQNLGFTGLLYGLLECKDGAVILLNSDGGERFMQEFITSVANAYEWPVMRTEQGLAIPPEMEKELSGVYENSDKSVKLIVEGGSKGLTARPASSKKGYPLYRIGNRVFTFKDAQDYYRLEFGAPTVEDGPEKLIYIESVGKTVELSKTQ